MPSAAHSALIAANVVTTPPVSGSGGPNGVEPTGSDIVSYRTLSGSTPTARLQSVASGQKVSLPPQTITWNDFGEGVQSSYPTTSGYGVLVTQAGQILGSGIDYTVLQMNQGSTSKYTQVGGTTKLEYFGATSLSVLQDLTLQGVQINGAYYSGATGTNVTDSDPTTKNIYNGFFFNSLDGFTMNRVKVSNIPGSYNAPPGETFGMDIYRCNNSTFNDIEIDGQSRGGSGWGPNFMTGTSVVNRLYSHDNKYGLGAAIYASSGTLTMTDCTFENNYAGVNIEDDWFDWVKLVRPTFNNNYGSEIDWWADTTTQPNSASFPLYIYDPVVVGGAKIRIRDGGNGARTHGGYPNVMNRSDVHVYVNGVEQLQSNWVTWLT